MNQNQELVLPSGYRFNPTDSELIVYYLKNKLLGRHLPADVIPTFDCFSCNPHQLPLNRFKYGVPNEWYFFSSGMTEEIITEEGYYIMSDDEVVYDGTEAVGSVRIFDFYYGKPPAGIESPWSIKEFRAIVEEKLSCNIVVCKIIFTEQTEAGNSS